MDWVRIVQKSCGKVVGSVVVSIHNVPECLKRASCFCASVCYLSWASREVCALRDAG
jgi:hypothetical protein